ncbi:MAG: glycoside hydrolase family 73 protein [Saprospiraceae bacterium]
MFKSKIIFWGFIVLLIGGVSKSSFAQPTNYIETYQKTAIREMHRSGIPASITLAQGILESSWGNGSLALKANNHFGIKCKSTWNGETFFIEDDDYKKGRLVKSCFRSYDNAEDSYVDHSEFLTDNPRYERLFSYDRTDYKKWAHGLKKCGYATDKKYAYKLINTIKKYKLYEFDLMPEEQPAIIASEGAPELDIVIAQNFPSKQLPKPIPNSMPAPEAFVLPDDYKRGDGLRKFASKGNKNILNSSSILLNKR